jgi:hypothetical protein
LATELIKAIPEAAANPVRNSLGSDQYGPYTLYMPSEARHKKKIEENGE